MKSKYFAAILGLLMTFGFTTPALSAELNKDCAKSILSAAAIITRIRPPDLPVRVQDRETGRVDDRTLGDCLGPGAIVSLPPKGNTDDEIELFVGSRFVVVDRKTSSLYEVPRTVPAARDRALSWLNSLTALPSAIGIPPRRPTPTGVRELGDSVPIKTSKEPFSYIGTLRNLPRQSVTSDATAILGWKNGHEPWQCEGATKEGRVVVNSRPVSSNWCEFGISGQPLTRLSVKDARGDRLDWHVSIVSPSDVPRPEWIAPGENKISAADRGAWAIWLWHTAGAQWKLQAMSMLNEASETSLLSAYLLNSILNASPLIQSAASAVR